ncbi:MAG TPA: type I-C CRISPR-associated protein Cas7/Csd2 [Armatimonadetes bacterium]|nr:type I-C CRISPR-associated protein Cas7/Csd2 [Armatimonadota bacterium]
MTAIQNRYEFVLLFDVKDGNPNGDPDSGNLPRTDPETGEGLVTDVSLKRKIRNFIQISKGDEKRFDIFIKEKSILNDVIERAYTEQNLELKGTGNKKKGKAEDRDRARQWVCDNFYDVRTFGAVLSTGANAGQVRGPVQLKFARSIDPIVSLEHSITRMAVTTEKEAEKQSGDNRTMGRKHTVPYGLYRTHGYISAHFAEDTGFSEEDLELLWHALENMFEHDRSAARGEMTTRGLYVFKHNSKLGNAPAHILFERIEAKLKSGISIPRNFSDYDISINRTDMPNDIQLIQKVG